MSGRVPFSLVPIAFDYGDNRREWPDAVLCQSFSKLSPDIVEALFAVRDAA